MEKDKYNFYEDNEDYDLVQKFRYKDKTLYQNCGINSEMVGEYNGYSIWQSNDKGEYNEVLHATLEGKEPLSIEEMKQKIIAYEKIKNIALEQIEKDEEGEEDF